MERIIEVSGNVLAVKGRIVRVCRLRDEYYQFVESPKEFIADLKHKGSARADIFTFIQEVPDREPKFQFDLRWDSAAVLSLSTYEHWWKKQLKDKTRNMVRKSQKAGVEIRVVPFDDELVRGIQVLYNESPIRQGRRFRHYGKDLETIRREHMTFLSQSQFIGAYLGNELIGFIKLVHGRGISNIMNIVSLVAHRDKAPNNALMAKAVEICTTHGVPLLQYGTGYTGTIGDFKKYQAFEEVRVPRYLVPISLRGRLALRMGLDGSLNNRVPPGLQKGLRSVRSAWNTFRFRKAT